MAFTTSARIWKYGESRTLLQMTSRQSKRMSRAHDRQSKNSRRNRCDAASETPCNHVCNVDMNHEHILDWQVQADLEKLLTVYCKRRSVRYTQGLNELIAPFFLLDLDTGIRKQGIGTIAGCWVLSSYAFLSQLCHMRTQQGFLPQI